MQTVGHSGNIGDILYSLPAMRQLGEVKLYLHTNVDAKHPKGFSHVFGDVRMPTVAAEALKPLLLATDFIKEVEITDTPPPVDYDFDMIRKINLKYDNHISRWYFYAFPELTCDLSVPIDFKLSGKKEYGIVLNRSERYNNSFDYSILRPWQHQITFVGLPREWELMKLKLPGATYQPTKDLKELATIIADCDLFIGNQSSPFAIAEIMKVPRILEVCLWAKNVIPTGGYGYDCLNMMHLIKILKKIRPIHELSSMPVRK